MEKKAYEITESAGREVAGMRNPGAGDTIELTASQAEHPLRLGHIRVPAEAKEEPVVEAPEEAAAPEPEIVEDEPEPETAVEPASEEPSELAPFAHVGNRRGRGRRKK